MADCMILGDSIAVGVAGVLHAGGWACAVAARVGATSAELPAQFGRAGLHPVAIISAGSNDAPTAALEANLLGVRSAMGRARVVWLLPYRRRAAYAVTQIAFRFGDDVVDLASFPSRDHVHPARYGDVAAALLR